MEFSLINLPFLIPDRKASVVSLRPGRPLVNNNVLQLQDCMYDYCAMPGDTGNLCAAAAAYVNTCVEAGAPVEGQLLTAL